MTFINNSPDSPVGIYPSFSVKATSVPRTFCDQWILRRRQWYRSGYGYPGVGRKTCYSLNKQSALFRILQQTVPRSKTRKQVASHHRPQPLKQIPDSAHIQDGNSRVNQSLSGTGRVGDVSGSTGCLFPHPYPRLLTKYTKFHIKGQTFQFKALSFGLSTAPMEHTMVKEARLMAQNLGMRIHQYLDSWLVGASTYQSCLEQTQQLVCQCQEFSWLVNWQKSDLFPKKIFDFVGYQLDLESAQVRSTNCRWLAIKEKVLDILNRQSC